MKKKLGWILSLTLCFALMIVATLVTASADDNVSYIDENGDEQTCASATVVTESDTSWGASDSQEHWYVVNSNVTINTRVTVTGNVHLILKDGYSLTVNGGIGVSDNDGNQGNGSTNSLTIYAQSTGNEMGSLTVQNVGSNNAGIGSGDGTMNWNGSDCGTITINGGNINVTSTYDAAGIGGGFHGNGGTITVNNGIINVTSNGSGGAGIGGGAYGNCGAVTITGGCVVAVSKTKGAAIGGGYDATGNGSIVISGGIVRASSGNSGIGISYWNKANITFSTGETGNAVIIASSISDNDNTTSWSGVIFQGTTGQVYGTSVTPTENFEIPEGYTLTIGNGKTLTIDNDITLTNNGTITVESGGTLTNNGTIVNNGTINGTVSGSGKVVVDTYYLNTDNETTNQQAIPVTTGSTTWGANDTNEHWYVVQGDVTIGQRVTVNGNVHLILADECNLTVNGGINVTGANSLTIYGQSVGENMGALTAKGSDMKAGIGGNQNQSGGTITINGGTVKATGGGGGAGIGGGVFGADGTITISGGTVTATGGIDGGAGIGVGGGYSGTGGTITISGGTVTATGKYGGAGIGGASGTITISGGTVTATGRFGGAGIGGNNSTFSTGENGRAVIFASRISDDDDTNGWDGVIFQGSTGQVYGTTVTPTEDFTIPTGYTLTIPAGATLNVNSVSVTNSGTIICNGTINGTIGGDVRYPSGVTVTFGGEGVDNNTAPYGSAINITATMTKQTATNALTAVEGTVDFWLGDVDTGTKLGTSEVKSGSDGTYTATLTVTLNDATKWIPSNSPYTITADFGGVAGTSGTGLLSNTGTAMLTVTKASQTAPAAPAMSIRTTTSVTLNAVADSGEGGVQYGYVKGNSGTPNNWQDETTFSGLQPGTDYTFYARYAGNDYYEPSPASEGLTVTTLGAEGGDTLADGETITTEDGTGTKITNDEGKITITPGDGGTTTTITPDDNATVNTGDGTVNVPGGSTVQTGDGPSITVGEDGATVDPDGGVTLPEGGSATVGDTEITVPGGGTIKPNGDGSVTIPGGSTVVDKDGDEYTYPPEGGTLDPDGTVVYTVTVTFDSQGGSDVASRNVEVNTPVAEPDAPTRSGYSFRGWYTAASGGEEWDFSAPVTEDMTLYARWSMNNIPDTYDIELIVGEGGEARTSLGNASAGTSITVTATPDAGYELDYITVDGERIDGTTFKMPAHDVTVRVYFTDGSALPFTDVNSGAWFYDYVAYVYANGLMDGTSDTAFEPNANMTRAMVWAILARIDGETVTGANWVETAREWAMAEGVSDGTDPNGLVTREQFATMLYRYAVAKGYDVSIGESTNILSYADFASISEYAIPAMQWACGSGIVTGVTDATLVPQGTATRAQCAAMLMRFAEL